MIPLPDQVARSYSALMRGDGAAAGLHCVEDVLCHVTGAHPFSGDYRGVAEIVELLRAMDEAGGEHSFTVTNVMSDDTGSQVLVEGVAKHGRFARHVINRLRYDGELLAEVWLKPLDQRAEDEFWCSRLPQQRAGGTSTTAAADLQA